MQSIISYSEIRSNIYSSKYDTYQTIAECFIKNDYFPWVCLVMLYNRNKKNWKRPINIILVAHWFLRCIGDMLNSLLPLRPWVPNTYWPYTNENWFICCALANVFWLSGEIIGDWYALLRTRAVTNKSKKTRIIFVTIAFYNLVKIANMYANFMDLPFDLRLTDDEGNLVKDIAIYKMKWWSIVCVMQFASLLYDLSVIFSLKTLLFNKLKEYKTFSDNTFLNKFKQISEFRIILSMIASIAFLPFVGLFLYYVLHEYRSDSATSYIPSDETVDYLRRAVLNFNYTLMYIDQILLRNITEKNSQPKPSSYNNIGASSYNSNMNYSNSNLNMSQKSMNISSNTNINRKFSNSNADLNGVYYNDMNKIPRQNNMYDYNENVNKRSDVNYPESSMGYNNMYNGTNVNNYKFQTQNNNVRETFIEVDNNYTYKKVIPNNKPSNVYYVKLKNVEDTIVVNNESSILPSPSSAETLYNDVYPRKYSANSTEINSPKISFKNSDYYNGNVIVKNNGNDKLLFNTKNNKYDSIYDLYSQQNKQYNNY